MRLRLLAFATAADALGANETTFEMTDGSSVGDLRAVNANASSLSIGDRTVALDGRSNLLLRFRGGRRTFPYVSAVDVVEGRTGDGAFRDKLVFVGATALGTQELVATPQDPRFIGVEVQATVADNLLQGDFLRRPAESTLIESAATLLAEEYGQPIERIAQDFDRDRYMTPEEAKEYGIIDAILTKEEPLPSNS